MYKLVLANGYEINGLTCLNPSTFKLPVECQEIYWQLTPENLSFVTLYKDGELDEVFLDYAQQNFYCGNGYTEFRIRHLTKEEMIWYNRVEGD